MSEEKKKYSPSIVQELTGTVELLNSKNPERIAFRLCRSITDRDTGEKITINSRMLTTKANSENGDFILNANETGASITVRATAEQGRSEYNGSTFTEYYGVVLSASNEPCPRPNECTLRGFVQKITEKPKGDTTAYYVRLSLPQCGEYNPAKKERLNMALALPVQPEMVDKLQEAMASNKPVTLKAILNLNHVPMTENNFPYPPLFGKVSFAEPRKPKEEEAPAASSPRPF